MACCLPHCEHKWLDAGNLGLLPLGTMNTHLVSFHWICRLPLLLAAFCGALRVRSFLSFRTFKMPCNAGDLETA